MSIWAVLGQIDAAHLVPAPLEVEDYDWCAIRVDHGLAPGIRALLQISDHALAV